MKPLLTAAIFLLFTLVPLGSVRAEDWTATKLTEGNGLTFSRGADRAELRVCREHTFLIAFKPEGKEAEDTAVIGPTPCPGAAASITIQDSTWTVSTATFQVTVQTSPLRFTLRDSSGKLLFEDVGTLNAQGVSLMHPDNQAFYGMSSDLGGAFRKQGPIIIGSGWNGGAGAPLAWTTAGYGVLWDTDGGAAIVEPAALHLQKLGKIDFEYYVIVGDPRTILSGVAEISGQGQIPPKFALGFMNFEWGNTQYEILKDIDTYREKKIPIDLVGIDYEWFMHAKDDFGDFKWNTMNFPDGASGVFCKEELARRGVKAAIMRKPWLGKGTVQLKEAQNKGFIYNGRDGKPTDAFNFHTQEARDWWWQHNKPLLATGIRAWWSDEAEEYSTFRFMEMQRTFYEGERASGNRRVWSLNRNFYLGSQRYAYTSWTGDIDSFFPVMAQQRGLLLSTMAIGQPWWSMDAGGFRSRPWWLDLPKFQGTPTPENYARWLQFAAFVPIMRVHGRHNQEREPWKFGTRAEQAAAEAIRFRYKLLPYLYSYVPEAAERGLSLVRPLIIDYSDDLQTAEISDEWLVGDSMLVHPVVEPGVTSVAVYLPKGTWIDYFDKSVHVGPGQVTRTINSETWLDYPLYVKRGAIIPTAAPMNFIGEKPQETLFVELYPDSQSSTFTLYDDDGETYGYEKGEFVKVPINMQRKDKEISVTFERAVGPFPLSYSTYVLRFYLENADVVESATAQGQALRKVDTIGALATQPSGWASERHPGWQLVEVKLPATASITGTLQLR